MLFLFGPLTVLFGPLWSSQVLFVLLRLVLFRPQSSFEDLGFGILLTAIHF